MLWAIKARGGEWAGDVKKLDVSILREMSKDTCESAELVTKPNISGSGQESYRLATQPIRRHGCFEVRQFQYSYVYLQFRFQFIPVLFWAESKLYLVQMH